MTISENRPALDVHFVNYFSCDDLISCISTIPPSEIREIRVLDNSCSEEEWQRLQSSFRKLPHVSLIRSEKNLGFGAGHNSLLASSRAGDGDLVWILNPDTTVHTGAIEALRGAVSEDTLVSPLLLSGDSGDTSRIWYFGGKVDLRRGRVTHDFYDQPLTTVSGIGNIETQFLTGAAIMSNIGLIRGLGGFREDLFLYWEDVEFSLRAARAGFHLKVIADALVTHMEGSSSGGSGSSNFYYWSARNRMIVGASEHQLLGYIIGRGSLSTLKFILRPLRGRPDAGLRKSFSALRGTLDGLGVSVAPSTRSRTVRAQLASTRSSA